MWGIVLVISTMPHFITTHSINNPNYIKMQQNKNQQLDAKFRKFIKVLIMHYIEKRSIIFVNQDNNLFAGLLISTLN